MTIKNQPLTYQSAGVNIDAGNELVQRIKPIAAKTQRAGVLQGLGGFGGLFELPMDRFRRPVLVSGTDGVGSKLKLAIQSGVHHTIGIDLVAMCVNDVVVCGAEPLFFLDYYATGQLDVEQATRIIEGIGQGCEQAGIALIGGETAEMPGMYAGHDYDLAGFCVGIVERDALLDGNAITAGDVLIGLASSGPHANGYSLIRKILRDKNHSLEDTVNGQSLLDSVLEPTRIYVKSLLAVQQQLAIHAMAHITGGGLLENIPRVLPSAYHAMVRSQAWNMPEIFNWLQQQGNIEPAEMYRTFNCGIGMVVIVAEQDVDRALQLFTAQGEAPYVLGNITKRTVDEPQITIQ